MGVIWFGLDRPPLNMTDADHDQCKLLQRLLTLFIYSKVHSSHDRALRSRSASAVSRYRKTKLISVMCVRLVFLREAG